MTDNISPEERAAWGRLAEAASPEPWDVEPSTDEDTHCAVLIDMPNNLVANFLTSEPSDKPAGAEMDQAWSDARFCAAARTALPRLLAENAELRAALAAIEKERNSWRQIVRDSVDDMECVPECDGFWHDALCPVTNTGVAWRKLRVDLAGAEAERDRLRATHDMDTRLRQEAVLTLEECSRQHAAAEAKLAERDARIAQLEHGYDTLRTALHRTEAKLADDERYYCEKITSLARANEQWIERAEGAEAKLAAAERALRRYGAHFLTCDVVTVKTYQGQHVPPCTCSFATALAAAPAVPASPKETHNG